MAWMQGLKIDTWPRWFLVLLSAIGLFVIGFYVNQTWATVVTVQQHIPIATQSFESISRTTNDLFVKQERLDERQEEVLLKLIQLETEIRLSRRERE